MCSEWESHFYLIMFTPSLCLSLPHFLILGRSRLGSWQDESLILGLISVLLRQSLRYKSLSLSYTSVSHRLFHRRTYRKSVIYNLSFKISCTRSNKSSSILTEGSVGVFHFMDPFISPEFSFRVSRVSTCSVPIVGSQL